MSATGDDGAGPPDERSGDAQDGTAEWPERMLERGLVVSRVMVLVPVVVLVLSAAGSFVYGAALFVRSAIDISRHPFPVGNKIGLFLLDVDLFLIGATLLIAAIGFYELFISRVDLGGKEPRLPAWLVMRDLNDLKIRVISMLVLVAAVSFVDSYEAISNARDILYLGGAVALVIAALTVFIRFGAGRHG